MFVPGKGDTGATTNAISSVSLVGCVTQHTLLKEKFPTENTCFSGGQYGGRLRHVNGQLYEKSD
jgi:hypothetical protein